MAKANESVHVVVHGPGHRVDMLVDELYQMLTRVGYGFEVTLMDTALPSDPGFALVEVTR